MSLDSRAESFLQALAMFNSQPVHTMTVEEVRARKQPPVEKMPPIAAQRELTVPTRAGSIPARLYHPDAPLPDAPLLVFIHGGGWIMGELDHYDPLCRALATESGLSVVSLDYRLAPEHPFPAALEDCLDAIEYLATGALGEPQKAVASAQPLIVCGDSAGGNLAAVVANEFRGHLHIRIDGQILIYPVTDCDFERHSYRENGEGYMLTAEMMRWFWDHYCPDQTQRGLPLASPLLIDSFDGLPATYVVTCQYDPLRDEGGAYAACLEAAGVETVHEEVPGMIHGFVRFLDTFPQASEQLTQIAQWSRQIAQRETSSSRL